MITIIFGAPGAGKSSLNTYFLKQTYRTQGRALLHYARARIEAQNSTRATPLIVPDKPPIFANYAVKFKTGYEKSFEPYFINGYYLGLPNDRMPTQYIPPGSKIFLSEAQRYYNSRKSQTLPDWVSRFYEMHRHYGIDVYLDVQRANLIDLNIKEICKQFIEVQGMKHETDYAGRILRSTFICREFENWRNVEQYLESGAETYRKTTYINEGNIFRCFNSYSYFEEYLPDESKAFNYLPFVSRAEQKNITPDNEAFYRMSEPTEYRTQAKAQKTKPEKEQKQ